MPQKLAELVVHCTETQPRNRPGNFEQVRTQLAQVFVEATQRSARSPAPSENLRIDHLQNKAIGFQSLEMHEEALLYYERALRIDPSDVDLVLGKASCLQCLHRSLEAIETCKSGLKIAPRDSDLLNTKGLAEKSLTMLQQARDSFEHAIQVSPRDAVLRKNLAETFLKMDLLERALECIEFGIAMDDTNCALLEIRITTLLMLNRDNDASEQCAAALKIAPRRGSVWKLYGVIRVRFGDYAGARQAFDRAIEIGPPSDELTRLKAETTEKLSQDGHIQAELS